MTTKKLITNADDYGYRPDISKAIIEAHTDGCLTSTTVLINFVSSEDIELAKQTPSLGFGLHLNLTSGEPLTDNWKAKYGSFSRPFRNEPQQFDQEIWIPFFEKYATEDILLEYEAQLEKFIELFGFLPTHLDSHHYTSSYASVFPAYIQLAKKNNLPVRLPKIWDVAANQHPMGKIIDQPELEQKLKAEGVETTDIFSLSFFNRYNDYVTQMKQEMNEVKPGGSIELSCHPGYEEEWRQIDLAIMKDSKAKALADELGFELVTFGGLK